MAVRNIFLEDLQYLEQTSTVEEFHQHFEAIRTLVAYAEPGIPEAYFTSLFIRGLHTEVQAYVEGFLPFTVLDAYYLACLFVNGYSRVYPHQDENTEVVAGTAANSSLVVATDNVHDVPAETIGFDNDISAFNVVGTVVEHDDKRDATDTILKPSHSSVVEVLGVVVVQDQTLLDCCANKQEFIALMQESLLARATTCKTGVIMKYDNVVAHTDIIEANCVEVESLVNHEDISGMKLLGYVMAVADATPQVGKDIEAPLCSNTDGLTCAPAIAHSRKTDRVVASMSAVEAHSVQSVAPVKSLVPVSENCVGDDLCSDIVCIKLGQFDMGLKAENATILDKGGTILRLALVSDFSTVVCSTYSLPMVAPISKCAIDAVDFVNDHSVLCDEASRVPTNLNLHSGAKSPICVMDPISITVVVSDLPIGGLYMLIVEVATCVSSMLVVLGAKVWGAWSGDACVHGDNIMGKGGTDMLPVEFILLGSNVHSHIPPADCCPDNSLGLAWWWPYAITISLVHNSSYVDQACSIAVLERHSELQNARRSSCSTEKSAAYYSLVQSDFRVLTAMSLVQVDKLYGLVKLRVSVLVVLGILCCTVVVMRAFLLRVPDLAAAILLYLSWAEDQIMQCGLCIKINLSPIVYAAVSFFPIHGGPPADVMVLWMTFRIRLTVDASYGIKENSKAMDFSCLTSNCKYSIWTKATKLDASVHLDIWMELSFTLAGYFTMCIALPQYEANAIVHPLIFQQITLPDFSEHSQSQNINDPTVLEKTTASGLCKDIYSSKESNKYLGRSMVLSIVQGRPSHSVWHILLQYGRPWLQYVHHLNTSMRHLNYSWARAFVVMLPGFSRTKCIELISWTAWVQDDISFCNTAACEIDWHILLQYSRPWPQGFPCWTSSIERLNYGLVRFSTMVLSCIASLLKFWGLGLSLNNSVGLLLAAFGSLLEVLAAELITLAIPENELCRVLWFYPDSMRDGNAVVDRQIIARLIKSRPMDDNGRVQGTTSISDPCYTKPLHFRGIALHEIVYGKDIGVLILHIQLVHETASPQMCNHGFLSFVLGRLRLHVCFVSWYLPIHMAQGVTVSVAGPFGYLVFTFISSFKLSSMYLGVQWGYTSVLSWVMLVMKPLVALVCYYGVRKLRLLVLWNHLVVHWSHLDNWFPSGVLLRLYFEWQLNFCLALGCSVQTHLWDVPGHRTSYASFRLFQQHNQDNILNMLVILSPGHYQVVSNYLAVQCYHCRVGHFHKHGIIFPQRSQNLPTLLLLDQWIVLVFNMSTVLVFIWHIAWYIRISSDVMSR